MPDVKKWSYPRWRRGGRLRQRFNVLPEDLSSPVRRPG